MLELVLVSTLNGVLYGMLLFLMASGLTLIFSMMGVLNFAHASFYMLGAFFGFQISLFYPRAVNEMRMLQAAIEKAKSLEPTKIGAALEGMKINVHDGGEGYMRADDHQFIQPLYIASFGERSAKEPFDEEGSGWGWKLAGKVEAANTVLPTTCKMSRPAS